jgi:hypothetical protein
VIEGNMVRACGLTLPLGLRGAIEVAAAADGRPVPDWIEAALQDAIERSRLRQVTKSFNNSRRRAAA